MDIYEAIFSRRSVRDYKPDAVPEDILNRVLDAGRFAPSGRNRQFWRVVVIREVATRDLVAAASPGNPFIARAPVILAHLGFLAFDGAPPAGELIRDTWTWEMYVRYNCSIAAAYITLAATAENLGTCWINNYDEASVRIALHIPPEYSLVCLMTLGYPAETPPPKPRHPLACLRVDNHFPDG